MTFKTSFRRIRENPLHLVWIILAMLELGVFILCYERFVLHNPSLPGVFHWARLQLPALLQQDIHRLLWGSYIDAGGIRVNEGISAFAGKSATGVWKPEHTMVIVSMVLSFIFGPALLLWGMKARRRWILEKRAKPGPFTILAATAIGGYIVAFALALPVVTSVESWASWQRMKADSYASATRDGAVASGSILGFQAQQLRLMPEAKGGGPWMKGPGGITIADIDTVLPRIERGLWQQGLRGSMKYFLEVDSPDSLTIWGVADLRGTLSGSTLRNKDSTTGNVQMRAGVTPARVTMMVEN